MILKNTKKDWNKREKSFKSKECQQLNTVGPIKPRLYGLLNNLKQKDDPTWKYVKK